MEFHEICGTLKTLNELIFQFQEKVIDRMVLLLVNLLETVKV